MNVSSALPVLLGQEGVTALLGPGPAGLAPGLFASLAGRSPARRGLQVPKEPKGSLTPFLESPLSVRGMTNPDDTRNDVSKTEDEISNVDLQFMGRTDEHRDAVKDAKAEARIADEFEERGLDKQDVASNGSMITSDPASTNPGHETSLDTGEEA
ncbi:hypothetical protein [Deinococcus hopiensis]|uniref:Uncharacterized protein n=1 Tax=Deinococcus hopiensis KR-140 TaxID=695939 RepID=A0A1W1VN54_9DEIO|nr:hypothetical protein [Deinococcus hopiensis]SMB94799.1 hypothetical protein SAMN00790413_02536 [Deinococcus hopiensis KR-140]